MIFNFTTVDFKFRVTQIYDAGVCVYFYFGFNGADIENALGIYDKIEVCIFKIFFNIIIYIIFNIIIKFQC